MIVIIGANPTQAHPVVGARIKQAALRGAKLVTIDPRRIELADYGVLHLSPRPGTNAAVLLGLMHVISRDGLIGSATSSTSAPRATTRPRSCAALQTRRPSRRSPAFPACDIERSRSPLRAEADRRVVRLGPGRDRAQVRLRGRCS